MNTQQENNATKKLERRVIELEKRLASKERFISYIAHEIKNPLHNTVSYMGMLRKLWEQLDESKQLQYLEKIDRNLERLVGLVDVVFDISAIQSGEIELSKGSYDLTKMTEDLVHAYEAQAVQKELSLQFVSLFPQGPIIASFDKARITQVIDNLLANAIRYGAGEIKVCVEKKTKDEVPVVQFSVSDQGIGVPEKELQDIFSFSFRSSRTTEKASGSGIGLNVCKAMVQAHQGEIWAKNNKGKGTTFYFTLPLKS